MKTASFIIVFFSFYVSFSQELTREALHYNSDHVLVRIERKYQSKLKNIYVTHTNWGSIYLQDSLVRKGDTTILIETLFEIPRINPLDIMTSLDGYVITSQDSINNTMTLSLFNDESFETEDKFLGDTILPIDFDLENFIYDLQESRLRRIHTGQIKVSLDSLIYMEAIKIKTINKLPIRIDYYDSGGNLHLSKFCSNEPGSIICLSKSIKDTGQYFPIDSIHFNEGKSHVQWKYSLPKRDTTYLTDYQIYDKGMVINARDTIEYLPGNRTFTNLINSNLIYYDFPFKFSLKFDFDRQKVTRINFSNRPLKVISYDFDSEGNIIRKNIFVDGQIIRYVEYQ